MIIISAIKQMRIRENMAQIELAQKLGVTQGAVSQWEAGVAYPRVSLLPKLAKILNCTVNDLIDTGKEGEE